MQASKAGDNTKNTVMQAPKTADAQKYMAGQVTRSADPQNRHHCQLLYHRLMLPDWLCKTAEWNSPKEGNGLNLDTVTRLLRLGERISGSCLSQRHVEL